MDPSQNHDVLLFPGQGSQTTGMREIVAAHRPDLLELALELVGDDPFERASDGTRFAQPALVCASLAGWERAGCPSAIAFAGHSLGELSALSAAGALTAEDGVRLAVRRGALMQEAAEAGPDGGMVALLGDDALAHAQDAGLVVANDNAPGQIVVSGPEQLLERAEALAAESGLRAIRLGVREAFHSPAMEAAVPAFSEELAQVDFAATEVPVYSSASAKPFEDPAAELAAALTEPVRWRETMIALSGLGAARFLEAGPGKVLTKMARRTLDGVEAETLDKAEPVNA
jgi:[acyl-carrier-protein] S-malonyltransferase